MSDEISLDIKEVRVGYDFGGAEFGLRVLWVVDRLPVVETFGVGRLEPPSRYQP